MSQNKRKLCYKNKNPCSHSDEALSNRPTNRLDSRNIDYQLYEFITVSLATAARIPSNLCVHLTSSKYDDHVMNFMAQAYSQPL
jgi:hypothetical protein